MVQVVRRRVKHTDAGFVSSSGDAYELPTTLGGMREFEPGYEDPVRLLAEAAACPDPEDERRGRAVLKLQRRSDAATFLAVAEATRSGDLGLRLVALEVLGQLGYTSGRPYREQTLPILLAELDQAQDPRLVQAAIIALAHLGDGRALTAVLRHASHRDAGIRRAVAFALASIAADERYPAPRVEEALAALAGDADEAVREWAGVGLDELRRSRP
jgi:HEAT repeat protein